MRASSRQRQGLVAPSAAGRMACLSCVAAAPPPPRAFRRLACLLWGLGEDGRVSVDKLNVAALYQSTAKAPPPDPGLGAFAGRHKKSPTGSFPPINTLRHALSSLGNNGGPRRGKGLMSDASDFTSRAPHSLLSQLRTRGGHQSIFLGGRYATTRALHAAA